jgi:hypothetical protein
MDFVIQVGEEEPTRGLAIEQDDVALPGGETGARAHAAVLVLQG